MAFSVIFEHFQFLTTIIGWFLVWNAPATVKHCLSLRINVSRPFLFLLIIWLVQATLLTHFLSFLKLCRQFKQNDNIIEEVKGDKYLYISSIFNPIHLFHLFLAEVRLYVSREYLFACQKELFFFLCECQFSCFYFSDLSPLSTSSWSRFFPSCFWQIWFVVSHYIVQNECPSIIVSFFYW